MISENVRRVSRRINETAKRVGKSGDDIILVCVTKEVGLPETKEAIAAGITDIGENYVQDAIVKFNALGREVDGERSRTMKWHFIGHLQTNKVKDAVRIFDLIHSVDSLKLAQAISERAGRLGIVKDVLIEVKTSEEATKYGILPEELFNLIEGMSILPNLRTMGLMTMAPIVKRPEDARPYFRMLRELRDKICKLRVTNYELPILSMGMSQDFEVAIEEGANIVRIGRAIFGG